MVKTRVIPVDRLGRPSELSPLASSKDATFISDNDCIVYGIHRKEIEGEAKGKGVTFFELAGPKRKIYFNPKKTVCGIVTCGGLCPGINDVIRAIVFELFEQYGVRKVLGYRYGYLGLSRNAPLEPISFDPDMVDNIHHNGGTILSSSRGAQDADDMVDTLVRDKVNILFAIGGDGTMKGARNIIECIKKRKQKTSVIAIPKTIDNDIMYVKQSFGFETAVEASMGVISSAHIEAKGAPNGIGLVKLMGRHSGYIASVATLANSDVNFCLIPELPFKLYGRGGFLEVLKKRLKEKRHVVIVVAEGAGQDLIKDGPGGIKKDSSGNTKLKDIGIFLKGEIVKYFKEIDTEVNLKYIDPSYIIRSVPANAMDSAYCLALGQNAVHAGMSGKTNTVIGSVNRHFIHLPIPMAIEKRNRVNPKGRLWKTVMEATLQPTSIFKK
ncbi:MAG: ATP-dependent 6-phosphofructokinase [Candidatus Omnitrophica bacterium]|nr:ATP-dependent 6-phosphofructokinase [Candidatus Omnitrophota bacterium]